MKIKGMGVRFRIQTKEFEIPKFMITDYLSRSRQEEMTPGDLETEIEEYLREGRVWKIYVRGKWEGMVWARVVGKIGGGEILNVGGVYMRPKSFSVVVSRRVNELLDGYARECGVGEIGFYTRREPAVFRRMYGNGLEVDSVVMTRKMKSFVQH